VKLRIMPTRDRRVSVVAPLLAFALLSALSSARAKDETAVPDRGQVAEGYPVEVAATITSGTTVIVHAGTVTVSTSVTVGPPAGYVGPITSGVVCLEYTSAHRHCCWLQFIWRAVYVTTAAGRVAKAGRVSTNNGPYDLTIATELEP